MRPGRKSETAGVTSLGDMPEAERKHIEIAYETAEVILEYGSGASTEFAAKRPGKTVFSVESDAEWARDLDARIRPCAQGTTVRVFHVDIGPTGAWGRPVGTRSWEKFHRYPLAVWEAPDFVHPDVVLIDGRFRPACFAAVCLLAQRPVRVLFDDYHSREKYHVVETFFRPVARVGRLAEFLIEPKTYGGAEIATIIGFFAEASYARRPIKR